MNAALCVVSIILFGSAGEAYEEPGQIAERSAIPTPKTSSKLLGKIDFAAYMRAAAVLMPVWDANQRHPGAAHYLESKWR